MANKLLIEEVSRLIKACPFTCEEIAKELGCAPSTVEKYSSGHYPSLKEHHKIEVIDAISRLHNKPGVSKSNLELETSNMYMNIISANFKQLSIEKKELLMELSAFLKGAGGGKMPI
jgi:predicted transcriptional regulator